MDRTREALRRHDEQADEGPAEREDESAAPADDSDDGDDDDEPG